MIEAAVVRDAIAAHLDGKLSSKSLLRTLLGYPSWRVPAKFDGDGTPGPVILSNDSGDVFVQIFSDEKAVGDCDVTEGGGVANGMFRNQSGFAAFQDLPDDIAWLDINPHSSPSIHFKAKQVASLKAAAETVEIELTLTNPEKSKDDFLRLRAYQGYFIVLRDVNGSMQMVLAPDEGGRQLAAVFTAQDCVDAFLKEAIPALGLKSPQVLQLPGDKLFSQLQNLPLSGVVFNCMGPAQPAPFGLQIADHVLKA